MMTVLRGTVDLQEVCVETAANSGNTETTIHSLAFLQPYTLGNDWQR